MDWTPIVEFLMSLGPWVSYVFMGLGAFVVLGSFIDGMVPDEKDGGWMKKILAVPILGDFLKFIKKFSPFNVKEEK